MVNIPPFNWFLSSLSVLLASCLARLFASGSIFPIFLLNIEEEKKRVGGGVERKEVSRLLNTHYPSRHARVHRILYTDKKGGLWLRRVILNRQQSRTRFKDFLF